jgi:methionine-rich copper-binding protein CopC
MRPRLLTSTAVLAALLLVWPQAALGHAELDSATPGAGDEVVGSPAEIVATFTQDLDMSRTTMELRDASGATLAEGPERGDGKRELRLALPVIPPGEYEVRWTSFSAEDGELDRGRYTFTVLPAPSPTPATTAPPTAAPSIAGSAAPPTASPPAPSPAAGPAEGTDASLDALLPIGIAVVAVAAIGAWLVRRR